MAIETIDSVILDVMPVIELDWLIDGIELSAPTGCAYPDHGRSDGAYETQDHESERDAKCRIGPGTKECRHRRFTWTPAPR